MHLVQIATDTDIDYSHFKENTCLIEKCCSQLKAAFWGGGSSVL